MRDQICPRGVPLLTFAPTESYITHFWKPVAAARQDFEMDPNDYQTATLFESRTTIESGTTGLRTWFASFALAQYLISHPSECTVLLNVQVLPCIMLFQ